MFDKWKNALIKSYRDSEIYKAKITNLQLYNQYKLHSPQHKQKICICNEHTEDITFECDGCKVWFHPKCTGTTERDIKQDQYIWSIWHCPWCSSDEVFTARHIPASDKK